MELFGAWLYVRLRMLNAVSRDDLERGIVEAMDALPKSHVRSWYTVGGYAGSS